jgi:hypothetical protein
MTGRYDMYVCRVATSVVFVSPYPTQIHGTLFYHDRTVSFLILQVSSGCVRLAT